MFSHKWTFSLTSLIVILALAFVVPLAMAETGGPTVKISVADNDVGDGVQTVPVDDSVATLADDAVEDPAVVTDDVVLITIEFSDPVKHEATATDTLDFNPADDVMFVYSLGDRTVALATAPTITWEQENNRKFRGYFTYDTTPLTDDDDNTNVAFDKVIVYIGENAAMAIGGDTAGKSNQASAFYMFTIVAPDTTKPTATVKLIDGNTVFPADMALIAGDTARIHIMLSEAPKEFKTDHVVVTEADKVSFDKFSDTVYIQTIKPKYANTNDIKVTVKQFEDRRSNKSDDPAAKEIAFKVAASKVAAKPKTAGTKVGIANDLMIPANGYLILAKDDGEDNTKMGHPSHIQWPGGAKDAKATRDLRVPRLRSYNITEIAADQWKDLESFLLRGGTIDLLPKGAKVQISEVMWATDGGSADRQWIEIKNTTDADIKTKDYALMFYESSESPPAIADVADRVSTLYNGSFWSLLGIGQSGRTNGVIERRIGDGDDVDIDIEIVQTIPLISMQRAGMPDATTGMYPDGRMMGSWAASVGVPQNFVEASRGLLVGTPGASPITPPPPPPVVTPPVVPDPTPAATASDIGITEIMVDTGGGRLPQWIELTNLSGAAVSLADWSVVIDNAADADVYGGGAPVTVSIGDVELGVGEGMAGDRTGVGEGQSVLLVAWSARNSGNFNAGRVVNLATQLEQTGRYQLLSYNGFRITLVPKQTSPVLASGDDVGNLGMNWDIPMAEAGRSSLIRREIDVAGMATMGTSLKGWRLASDTDLISGPTSWYGSDEDSGTPGYDSGGPLPVELSMFYPARDKVTGQVVIAWETQSELNNAGFFIKRSEARNGKFTVINPQMIAGAGTTSEKQSYTYTDTSAKPNVVYYYQIEDVSLDGQRQLLTIGTRLRGHIGAAGKATTTWGELKRVQE